MRIHWRHLNILDAGYYFKLLDAVRDQQLSECPADL